MVFPNYRVDSSIRTMMIPLIKTIESEVDQIRTIDTAEASVEKASFHAPIPNPEPIYMRRLAKFVKSKNIASLNCTPSLPNKS